MKQSLSQRALRLSAPRPAIFVPLFVLIFFSLALRFISLEFRGFWVDELITWRVSQLPPIALILNRLAFGHLPTYFLMVKGWAKIFGDAELGLRSLSVVASALSIVAYFFMVRTCESDKFSLWSTLLFSIHSINLWAAQEARVYSLVILASILSTHSFLSDLKGPRRGRLALFTCSSLFGLLLHISYIVIYLVQLVFCVVWHRHHHTWRWHRPFRYVIGLVLILPAWIFVGSLQGQYVALSSGSPTAFQTVLKKIAQLAIGDYYKLVWRSWFMWIVLLAVAWALWTTYSWIRKQRCRKKPPAALPLRWFSVYWFFGSVAVIYLSSLLSWRDTASSIRYYSVALGGSVLLITYATSLIRARELRLLCQGTFAALLALNTGAFIHSKGDMVREAVAFVQENWQAGDALMVCDDYIGVAAFAFYGTGPKETIGLSDDLLDEQVIWATVERAASGKKRLWLFLYHEKPSPVVDVLVSHPERLSPLVRNTVGKVKMYCFHILPP